MSSNADLKWFERVRPDGRPEPHVSRGDNGEIAVMDDGWFVLFKNGRWRTDAPLYHEQLAEFTPVQVYTCNGTAAQQWTVASGNTLQVLGKCLDVDAAGTTDGTTVDLYDCNGTGAQVWVPQSDGALLNPNSGKCLDDTNWSTTPGTQLQI